jgi:hypothetical protein
LSTSRALNRVITVSLIYSRTEICGPRAKINLGTQPKRSPEMTVRTMQESTQNIFQIKLKYNLHLRIFDLPNPGLH